MAEPTVTPTSNPVPSKSGVDLIYNAQTLDIVVSDQTKSTAMDRFGNEVDTLKGYQEKINAKMAAADSAIANTGLFPVSGSFETGGTITERNQYLQLTTTVGADVAGGYSWGGVIPLGGLVVAAGSAPATTGGTPQDGSAWVYRGDATLRSELSASGSTVLIAGSPASAIAQSIKDKITISELVRGFGAAAWEQAVNYKTLVINQSVTKSGQYIIPAGQTIIFENNAAVIQSDNLTAFIAQNNDWHMMGAGFILQESLVLPNSEVAASRGILVSASSFNWSITGNIRVMWFKGSGFEADGGSILTGATGCNQISGLACEKNWNNLVVLDGFPAEYLTLSNVRSIWAANVGALIEAGNLTWVGGDICYNKGGVKLRHPTAGGNPHHGIFSAVNVNHNVDYQLHAEITAAGYDFNACHFYDNDEIATPTKGGILLDRCRGINITGGTIACNIVPVTEGGFVGHVGYNRIAGNKIDRARSIVTGEGFDRTRLLVEENFDNGGSWAFNDAARVFAQSRIGGAPQVLTGASSYGLMDLGTKIFDNRNKLGASFVTPFSGVYNVSLLSTITSSVAFTTEHIVFARDDSATGNFGELYRVTLADIADPTNQKAMLNFIYEFVVSKGGQVQIYLFGANPVATYSFNVGTLLTIKSAS